MTEWKCSTCGYNLTAKIPPKKCPSCQKTCEFTNVSCYIPECQDTGRDSRL